MKADIFHKIKFGFNSIHIINLLLIILDIQSLVSNNFNHEYTIVPIQVLLIIYPILQLLKLEFLHQNKVLLKRSYNFYILQFTLWIIIYFLILIYLFIASPIVNF